MPEMYNVMKTRHVGKTFTDMEKDIHEQGWYRSSNTFTTFSTKRHRLPKELR